MRFIVKFNNGAWKLFDRHEFTDVGIFGLERKAKDACDNANLDELNAQRKAR